MSNALTRSPCCARRRVDAERGIRACRAGNNPELHALELHLAQGRVYRRLNLGLCCSPDIQEDSGTPPPSLFVSILASSVFRFVPPPADRSGKFSSTGRMNPLFISRSFIAPPCETNTKSSAGGRMGSRARRQASATIFFWRQPTTWTSTSESQECTTVENARPTAPTN